MADNLGDGIKKLILVGIGAAAVTAEKSQQILDELVKKGELSMEQGKVLYDELKHDLNEKVKDHVNVSVSTSDVDTLSENLEKLSAKDLEILKKKVEEAEEKAKAEEPQEE